MAAPIVKNKMVPAMTQTMTGSAFWKKTIVFFTKILIDKWDVLGLVDHSTHKHILEFVSVCVLHWGIWDRKVSLVQHCMCADMGRYWGTIYKSIGLLVIHCTCMGAIDVNYSTHYHCLSCTHKFFKPAKVNSVMWSPSPNSLVMLPKKLESRMLIRLGRQK